MPLLRRLWERNDYDPPPRASRTVSWGGAFGPPIDHLLLLQLQLPQLGPPRIDPRVVFVVGRIRVIQRLAADLAEAGAVRAAEELGRDGQDRGVVGPATEIELLALDVGAAQGLVIGVVLGDLAGVDLGLQGGALETAHAGPLEAKREAKPEGI